MKALKKKHLITAGVCAGILAVLATVLLLFSCGSGDEAQPAPLTPSERAAQLYPAVVASEHHAGTAFRDNRPEGYPEKVGDVLAMMMSLHENDASYLYHVAFRDGETGDASTKESISKRLTDAEAFYTADWAEISGSQGWFYFLFTADEIRTLAGAGIECRFVGSGGDLSNAGDKLTPDQVREATCQVAGDSFLAKKGE